MIEIKQPLLTIHWDLQTSSDVAYVRLSGAVDLVSEHILMCMAHQLEGIKTCYVDAAAITFAGATLMNFLAVAVRTMPQGSRLTLCNPPPLIAKLVDMTGISALITVVSGIPRPLKVKLSA
jgi:anti-anti-sigma factor